MFWLPTLVVLLWCVLGVRIVRSLRSTLVLRANQPSSLKSFPRVSIIVAARNEEEALPAALESLLALDYPDFEIVLVDDDSQDHTGAIADEWTSKPAARGRLKVLHNKTLPPQWHGKVHALHLASSAASGEWILATDADMVLHPAVLRVAVSVALERHVQFLSIIPELEFGSFWEKVVLPAFSFLITSLFPVHLINDPTSPRALAAGAFILMKRGDLDALGGYARLRNVLIEDLRMAELFKRTDAASTWRPVAVSCILACTRAARRCSRASAAPRLKAPATPFQRRWGRCSWPTCWRYSPGWRHHPGSRRLEA